VKTGADLAEEAGRPYIYLRKRIRKEDRVRQIIREEGLTEGLVCVFGVQESCGSFKIAYGEGRTQLRRTYPRCLAAISFVTLFDESYPK
jgi:hypothetical protein